MNKIDKVLITGGQGMLGHHIASRLDAEGHKRVVAIGRRSCDLLDAKATENYFAAERPRYVIHCAAKVFGIMGNMMNQGPSYYENNLINTNVIEAARKAGVEKVTALGTGAVYPAQRRDVYYTSDIFEGRPHHSEEGYAMAKRGMLAMLETYKESYGMDYAYVVSCNLFGPNDKFDPKFGHVVPALIRKFYEAKRDGTDVIVWGDGSAQRDFLYVKDAANAVRLIADKHSGPMNIGSGSVWRIAEIVRVLTKISGLPAERVLWDSTKPNGQAHRAYDLAPLKALGFEPAYSIAAGLQETWDWYARNQ